MKVVIYNFAMAVSEQALLPYKHNESVETDNDGIFMIVRCFFARSLNVMLYHGDEETIIFVDTKRFQQR